MGVEYFYYADGRRVEKDFASGGADVSFLHAGDMEIAEYSASGQLLRRYIPGAGVDDRAAMVEADGTRHYYRTNRLGSVIAVMDAAGAVTDRYVYTPFGVQEPLIASGNPFRYTGRRYDPETGLYCYRARYLDAEHGRFLQPDPVLYADQMNFYAYVGNDPLNATDPTGLHSCSEIDGSRTGSAQITCSDGAGAVNSTANGGTPDAMAGTKQLVPSERAGLVAMAPIRPGGRPSLRDLTERHDGAVRRFQEMDVASGYLVEPGGSQVMLPTGSIRYYDYFMVDPSTGSRIGIEVKTTVARTLRLSPCQVACDVQVMILASRGEPVVNSRGDVVNGVGYRGMIFGPGDRLARIWSSPIFTIC